MKVANEAGKVPAGLRVSNDEALPEKRSRILECLKCPTDQGVTQLLANVDEEVDAIEQRISELNQTLVKVDFREGDTSSCSLSG